MEMACKALPLNETKVNHLEARKEVAAAEERFQGRVQMPVQDSYSDLEVTAPEGRLLK